MATKKNAAAEKETTPGAFLNGAKHYVQAGDLLLSASATTRVSLDPIYMLYFHAAELALKAFLRFKGEKKWGHDLKGLHDEAIDRGLAPEAANSREIRNVIELLHSGNVQQGFRYFTWESRNMPEVSWAGKVVILVTLISSSRFSAAFDIGSSAIAYRE